MKQFIIVTISIVVFTLIFDNIKNKSNFSKYIMIPLIVAILTKYIVGDFDNGYIWTFSDGLYWIYIFLLSYIILLCFSQFK